MVNLQDVHLIYLTFNVQHPQVPSTGGGIVWRGQMFQISNRKME